MNEVLDLLLRNLDAAYSTRGWHGPTLRGTLRGVTAKDALRRPSKGRHNVWELTAHAAYWKYVARNRLRKGKRGSFGIKGSNWFASPTRADDDAWRALVQLLDDEHQLLRDAVASLSDAELRNAKTLRLVYGVAAHDVYHAGQIQLVKRLVR
jgi:hypothetical protein